MAEFEFDFTDYSMTTDYSKTNKGMEIKITKNSSVDKYLWEARVNNKEVAQVNRRCVRACSDFVMNVLTEITGLKVQGIGQYSGYAIGENAITVNYVDCIEKVKFSTEFNTPAELKEYLIHTVTAIKAKVVETDKEESVTFNILY